MRLDHLLSKEHFLTAGPRAWWSRGQFISECLMLVAHGWNVDYSALSVCLDCEYCFGVENSSRGGECRARCWVSEGAAVWLLPLVLALTAHAVCGVGVGWLVVG